ncbi:MAG: D-tyrosyl-tRNA(Tyr) deacylase [Myxococcales bacterium]|nr:D-tyrosyl-tRNA(Tyr) deacylase [Myxococcales bacterium]
MRAVIQRVRRAQVSVGGETVGQIDQGLLALVCAMDNEEPQLEWWAKRLTHLRCFPDEQGRMQNSLIDIDGGLLLVSQFTLSDDGRKGLRPSFSRASDPAIAEAQLEALAQRCRGYLSQVETGVFGADMLVELSNDGPVTLILDHA